MTPSDKNKNVVVTQEFVDKLIDKIGKLLKDQYTLFEHDNEKQELIELLSRKVGLIEGNFEELTKSLAKGSYPVKLARSIRVTESLSTPQIQAIEISKSQLIQTYNEIVSLLSGYAIPVTLTPDSYRNLNGDSIILETTIKGNYWVITTLENKQHQYWLVPNSNLKFNIHQLKTIETLFTFKGNYNSQTTDFILQEPAILSLLPNNKHWKLLQPGILFFGENKTTQPEMSPINTTVNNPQQAELNRQILSNLVTLKTTVKELNDKVLTLEIDATVAQKEHQREQQKWQTEKQALNKKLQEFITSQSQLNNSIKSGDRLNYLSGQATLFTKNTDKSQSNLIIEASQQIQNDLKNKLSQFRHIYQQDKKLILDKLVAKVTVSIETLENITLNKFETIILDNTHHGKYWIIDYANDYCLIPSDKLPISYYKSITITNIAKTLFDFSGYYPEYSDFQLIRPATVSKVSSKQWKLEKKGKLIFS